MRERSISQAAPFVFTLVLLLAGLFAISAEPVLAQTRIRSTQGQRAPNPLSLDKVEKLIEQQHREADQSRDGYLTVAELRSQIEMVAETIVRERFGTIDKDQNSVISYAEFSAWQRSMGSQALDDTAATGRDQALVPNSLPFEINDRRFGRELRLLVRPLNVTMLVQADSNYDGQVSVEELKAVQTRRFKELDTNSDDYLVSTELPSRSEIRPDDRP